MLRWVIEFPDTPYNPVGINDFIDDQLIIYSGLYSIPSYCIWYMAPDKTRSIYPSLIFKVVAFSGPERISWAMEYIVKSISYGAYINGDKKSISSKGVLFKILKYSVGLILAGVVGAVIAKYI